MRNMTGCPRWNKEMKVARDMRIIPTRRMKMGRGSECSANKVVGDNADMDKDDKDEGDNKGGLRGFACWSMGKRIRV